MPKFTRSVTAGIGKSPAYWISPVGRIVPVDDTHIAMVIAHPEMFDMTRSDVDREFTSRGERVGQEGKARLEIVLSLVDAGWIRLRLYRNIGWEVNVKKVTPKTADLMQGWAEKAIAAGHSAYEPVRLDTAEWNPHTLQFTMEEVASGALHNMVESVKVLLPVSGVVDAGGIQRQHRFLTKHEADAARQYACVSEAYQRQFSTDDGCERWTVFGEELVRTPDGSVFATAECRSYLLESSLSRLWKHAGNGFVTFTGFRHERDLAANREVNARIQRRLRDDGVGFIQVMGRYVEEGPDGAKVPVTEETFFVPMRQGKERFGSVEELIGYSIDILKEMDPSQEAVLWGDGKTVGARFLRGGDQRFGSFTPVTADKAYDAWTELRRWGQGKTGKGFAAEKLCYGIRFRTRALETYDGCMMPDGAAGHPLWTTQELRR